MLRKRLGAVTDFYTCIPFVDPSPTRDTDIGEAILNYKTLQNATFKDHVSKRGRT